MSKPSLEGMPQPVPGDKVCLLIGNWELPTHDIRKTIEALYKVPGISRVWLCPLASKDKVHVSSLCNIFCTEYALETSQVVTNCSVGLDKEFTKPQEILSWVSTKFPFLSLCVAGIGIEQVEDFPTYSVIFSNQPYPKNSPQLNVISLNKHILIGDVREKIKKGADESRNMYYGVWTYVQDKRLYR